MPPTRGAPPRGQARQRCRIGLVAIASLLVGMAGPGMTHSSEELVVVAARMLRPGTVITPADLALGPGAIAEGFAAVDEIVGMEAQVMLYPQRPIRPEDVSPPAVVMRNQIVILRYKSGGLTILAEGRALGRAAEGEHVRVLNTSSRNTVTGRARAGGTVDIATENFQ